MTLEQRAFLAGMALMEYSQDGDSPSGADLIHMVDRLETVATEAVTPERWTAFMGYQVAQLRMSEYFAAEEAQRNAALARGGPDVSKSVMEWNGEEWKAAVTALACYRYYLQRELSAASDFLCSKSVRQSAILAQLADDATDVSRKEMGDINMPMVDPVWARKLLRRVVKEIQTAIGQRPVSE